MDTEHIVVSDQHLNPQQPGFFRRVYGGKKILIVVGILIIAEVIWAGYTLTRPVTSADTFDPNSGTTSTVGATLALEGPSEVAAGEQFTVEVLLSSPGKTDGADVAVNFDPKLLELVQSGGLAGAAGTVYSEYPVNSVEGGRINISGAAPVGGSQVSEGNLATLTFKAKAVGKTTLSIAFEPGSSSDSNVVDSLTGNDILEEISNLEITIN